MSEQQTAKAPIDVAEAHFAEQKSNMRHMTVPEWGNLKIYVQPLSQEEVGTVVALAEGKNAWVFPAYVAYCARDASGKQIYGIGAVERLAKKVDTKIVQRIASWIMEDTDVSDSTIEEAEKNS